MSFFIFQSNPESFDINGYLDSAAAKGAPIRWLVNQHEEELTIGDYVFLWRSQGKTPGQAGVVGFAKVTSSPAMMDDDPSAPSYWLNDKGKGRQVRVDLELIAVNTNNKQLVKRDWMKDDPMLFDLGILKMASGTNFPISSREASRLNLLVQNTGVPWNKSESIAGLWLYNRLIDKPISKSKDSLTAQVAVNIGRAVTGVYNKVLNFRALDPRDDRAGLSGGGATDKVVWESYYDPDAESLKTEQLEADYQRIWGAQSIGRSSSTPGKEPNEAVDDDVAWKRLASLTRRRGQPAFRKRLLYLYDHKCAISGVNIDLVIDAAHIVNHAVSGVNHSDNGILLRSDLHDLFDAGLLVIDPDQYTVQIDESLSESEYWSLNGKTLHKRIDGSQPSKAYIAQKNRAGG
jgi:predicted RNA-binding protein with PUA-like domain